MWITSTCLWIRKSKKKMSSGRVRTCLQLFRRNHCLVWCFRSRSHIIFLKVFHMTEAICALKQCFMTAAALARYDSPLSKSSVHWDQQRGSARSPIVIASIIVMAVLSMNQPVKPLDSKPGPYHSVYKTDLTEIVHLYECQFLPRSIK